MSAIKVGDVIRFEGSLWVCDLWSDCSARMRPLTASTKTFVPRFTGGEVNEERRPVTLPGSVRWIRISAAYDGEYVARLGMNWQKIPNLSELVPGLGPQQPKTKTEKEETMKTKTSKTARGGLAAAVADRKASEGKAPKAGKSKKADKQAAATEKNSRAAFIDPLFDGTRKKSEILKLTVKQFGITEKDVQSVKKQISDRPFYIRKAGGKPSWLKEDGTKAS